MARGKGRGRGKSVRGTGTSRGRGRGRPASNTRPSQNQNDICLDRIPVLLISRLESMNINPANLDRNARNEAPAIESTSSDNATNDNKPDLLEVQPEDSENALIVPDGNASEPQLIANVELPAEIISSEVEFNVNLIQPELVEMDLGNPSYPSPSLPSEAVSAAEGNAEAEEGNDSSCPNDCVASVPDSETNTANTPEEPEILGSDTVKSSAVDIDTNTTMNTNSVEIDDTAVTETACEETLDSVSFEASEVVTVDHVNQSTEVEADIVKTQEEFSDMVVNDTPQAPPLESVITDNLDQLKSDIAVTANDQDPPPHSATSEVFPTDTVTSDNPISLENEESTNMTMTSSEMPLQSESCEVFTSGPIADVDETISPENNDDGCIAAEAESAYVQSADTEVSVSESVPGETPNIDSQSVIAEDDNTSVTDTQSNCAPMIVVSSGVSESADESVTMDNRGNEAKGKPIVKKSKNSKAKNKAPSGSGSESTNIRRSSRIETLETRRGGQRRREVVFATGWEKESVSRNIGDDESNSSSSSSLPASSTSISKPVSNISCTLGSPPRDGNGNYGSTVILSPSSLLKLKSRWRFSSDAESFNFLGNENQGSEFLTAPVSTNDELEPNPNLVKKAGHILYDQSDVELGDKLTKFQGIDENLFRSAQRSISKESRGLLCDCYLSKEEILRGEIGCNENCLNRLLMVECGARCPTAERCTNKKFQRREYCKLEVFKTEKKGHGLRTRQSLPNGGFVIEYVGEVLDPRGFARRIKEYAKDNQEHFYFMALKSDSIIDATQKGNCSRFINHSCEPNCETQKWTVNGELRIGFYAIKDLAPGEEITFDYQFQRYGKEAQRCYCLTPSCRGWIGGDDNEDEGTEARDEEENEVGPDAEETETTVVRPKVKRRYVRKQKKAEALEDKAFEEELSKLAITGLRNKNQTLSLCRLMVRAEKWEARERILNILMQGDTPCRRLFLDYHGLRLIWGWMLALPTPTTEHDKFESDHHHNLFIKTLHSLPIPNKTMLQDSKVLSVIEKWSHATPVTTRIVKVPKSEDSETKNSVKPVTLATLASNQLSTKLEFPVTTKNPMQPDDSLEFSAQPIEALKSSPIDEPSASGDLAEIHCSQSSTIGDTESVKVKMESPEVESGDVVEDTGGELTVKSEVVESIETVAMETDGEGIVKMEATESKDVASMNLDEVSLEVDTSDVKDIAPMPDKVETVSADDKPSSEDSSTTENEAGIVEAEIKDEEVTEEIIWEFVSGSKDLLASWSGLQEVFRIPKKERVEQMKEHEREADKSDRQRSESDKERSGSSYDRDRGSSRYRGRTDRRTSSVSSDSHSRDRERPREYYRNRTPGQGVLCSDAYSNLSKEERRNLFAAKVAQKEEEDRNRRITDETVSLHQERCARLGLDPATTPIVDPSCVYYLDPATVTWREINLEDPTLPHGLLVIVQSAMFPPQMMFAPEPNVMEIETAEEELFPPWPQGLLPPPPLPPAVLPKYWKMNVDEEGRCYYYDVRTKISQWTPPSPSSDVDSNSDDSALEETEEDADSLGATTSGDESTLSVSGDSVEDQSQILHKFQSWMTNRSERRKRSGLVTERIISPRTEEDKSLSFISQSAIRENKLQVAERKGKKVMEMENFDTSEAAQEVKAGQSAVVVEQVGSNVSQCEKGMEIDEDGGTNGAIQSSSPCSLPAVVQKQPRRHEKPKEKERVTSSPGGQENSPGTKPSRDQDSVQNENQALPDIETLNLNESLDNKSEDSTEAIPGLLDGTLPPDDEEKKGEDLSFLCTSPLPATTTPSTSQQPNLTEERPSKRKHKKSKHVRRPSSSGSHHQQPGGSLSKEGRERERMSDDRKTKAANIETFRNQIANIIVQHLNPYRKSSCKNGHILSTEDFKHLARKMTHSIALKEMKHSKDGKTIVVNESVKHKTREYVKKYMGRFQGNYVRSPEDTQS